jgi:hypothetical protein
MSVLANACAAHFDVSKELQDFQNQLNAIEDTFNAGVRDIQALDNDEFQKQLDTVLSNMDDFFSTQSIGSLRNTLKDSGVRKLGDSSDKSLEDQGFLKTSDRYFIVNNKQPKSYSVQQSTYFVGIGAGVADIDTITSLVGHFVYEPDESVLADMAGNAGSVPAVPALTPTSVMDDRGNSGNISRLRELYRSCGSSVTTLKGFLEKAYDDGFGVVYSTSVCVTVIKPPGLTDDEFDFDYVRTQVPGLCFEEESVRVDDTYYVRLELFVGYNITHAKALALLPGIVGSYTTEATGSLIARTVEFDTQEDVLNTVPVISSVKCDASKLSDTHHTIGLVVNGVYRVIDVTGDAGLKITKTTYNTQDIAAAITAVFGDFVEVGVLGTEFFVKLKHGYGSYGVLGLFWSGDTDCSGIIGLERGIKASYKQLAMSGTAVDEFNGLKATKEVLFAAGKSRNQSTVSKSYFKLAKDLPQKTVLDTMEPYYGSEELSALLSEAIQKASPYCVPGTADNSVVSKSVADIESALSYYHTRIRYREFLGLASALGDSNLDVILRHKTHIWNLDVWDSAETTINKLASKLQDIIAGSGTVATQEYVEVQNPYAINQSTCGQLAMLFRVIVILDSLNEDSTSKQEELCNRLKNLSAVTSALFLKQTNESAFTKVFDGIESTTVTNNASDYVTKAVYGILASDPDTSGMLSQLAAGDRAVEDLANYINKSSNKKSIGALLMIERALDTATRVVSRYTSMYGSSLQKIQAISSTTMNMNTGFQSKYLQCYVTGGVTPLTLLPFAKVLEALNAVASKINEMLEKLRKLANTALDSILCMADKLMQQQTGSFSYETSIQAGIVSFKAQCTGYLPVSATLLDPDIMTHLVKIRGQINALISAMQLSIVTIDKHSTNIDAGKLAFQSNLELTMSNLFDQLKKCF